MKAFLTLCLLGLAALALLAVALAGTSALAQTPGTTEPGATALRFFDTFRQIEAAQPVGDHSPELDEAALGWAVHFHGASTTSPYLLGFSLRIPPGTGAFTYGPTEPRRTHFGLDQPSGYAGVTTTTFYARYLGPQDYVAVRVEWNPRPAGQTDFPDAIVELVHIEAGQLVHAETLGSFPHTGYARTISLVVEEVAVSTSVRFSVYAERAYIGNALVAASTALDQASGFGFAAAGASHPSPDTEYVQVTDLAVTTAQTPPGDGDVCPGLKGWQAETCLRQSFAPLRTHPYDHARDLMFERVWALGAGHSGRSIEAIYGGKTVSWTYGSFHSPRTQVQDEDLNTEHVWPRSRGAQQGSSIDSPSHNDLHHLAPAFDTFNSARSNRAFSGSFDQIGETAKWLKGATTYYPSDFAQGYPANFSIYSRVEVDFLHAADNGDGFKSLDELGRFDVRHSRRGDVARMAAYFLFTYRIEAQDGEEGRGFIELMLETLLAWHEQDPVDDAEIRRSEEIYLVQGNRNPFILDAGLLRRTFYEGPDQPRPRDLWINEIHATNEGPDVGEGIEIAGRAGTDLYGYRVHFYSGWGGLYTATVGGENGDTATSVAFRGTIDDEGGNGSQAIGAVWADVARLRGGCQGLALTDPDGELIQFLSYGGCQFNALTGPVAEWAEAQIAQGNTADSLAWSTPIRGPVRTDGGPRRHVQEWSKLPEGYSIQLTGAGSEYGDFAWGGPYADTPGRLNDYQAPGGGQNATSGYVSGQPVPAGLPVPAHDDGHDEDLPGESASEADQARLGAEVDRLSLDAPFPNPARTSAELSVAAPTGSLLSATVYDVLGRSVMRFDPDVPASGHMALRLDLASLPAGAYIVRVTADLPGGSRQSATRRLTVVH